MSVEEMKKMKKLFESVAEPEMMPEKWPTESHGIQREMDDVPPEMAMDYDAPPGGDSVNNTAGYVGDDMASEGGDAGVIEELDAEFKRITSEYLQAAGPLDSPEHADMRKKLTDHMKKILDELHDGWMSDMMDDGASEAPADDGDSDDTPEFFGGTDDDADDSDEPASDDDDDSEADDDSDDDDSDDEEDKDTDESEKGVDEGDNNPFTYNESLSSAENMRRMMEHIK